MGRRNVEEIRNATQDESLRKEVLAYNQEDVMMLRCIEEALQKR